MKRLIYLSISLAIFLLVFAAAGFGQGGAQPQPISPTAQTQAPLDKQTAKIKEQVKKIIAGDKVTKKVRMKNGTTYRGFIGTPTEDAFVVQDKTGGLTTIKYSDVVSIDKKDVSTPLKIGLGAAAGVIGLFLIAIFAPHN